jgi:hypothetical protein
MAHFMPYLVGSMIVLALDHSLPGTQQIAPWPAPVMAAAAQIEAISNRSYKGDRLEAPESRLTSSGGSTETGATPAVSVAPGNLQNITIVVKTRHQAAGGTVKRVPVELLRKQARDPKPKLPERTIPVGCDPSFSPVASPLLAGHTGRCLV